MIGIYKITSPSSKTYIGQSINIEKRIMWYKRLRCKSQKKLYNSFIKYGVDAHNFEIIEECDILLLNERERYWQDYYDVLNNGLNLRLTSTNDRSGKMSKESIRDRILLEFSQHDIDQMQEAATFGDGRKVFSWEGKTDKGIILDIDIYIEDLND